MVRTRRSKRSKRSKHVPKSPNIVAEGTMRINGRVAAYRAYKKAGHPDILVATIHVGKREMYNKSPRLGKKKKSRSRR